MRNVIVANRSPEAARRLALGVGGRAVRLEEVGEALGAVDVVLCSVQVSSPLLLRTGLEEALRRRQGRPLLIIDLGLPRNVEPEANELENLYLYDLDDLERVAVEGREWRRGAAQLAEGILRAESERFEQWRETLPLVPTIQGLLEESEALAREEVRRALSRLDGADPVTEEILLRLGESIVHKILHRPLTRLQDAARRGTGMYYAEAVRRIFGPEGEDE